MREIALFIGIILFVGVGQFIGGCVAVVREYQVPAVPPAVQQYYYSPDPFGYPGGLSVDLYISGQTFGVPPTIIPPVGYVVVPGKHHKRHHYGKKRFIVIPVVPVIPLYPYYAPRVAPLPRVLLMPPVLPMR